MGPKKQDIEFDGEDTVRVRRVVRSEVNGTFVEVERWVHRIKLLTYLLVTIAGAGFGANVWIGTLAKQEQLKEIEEQIESLRLEIQGLKDMDMIRERQIESIERTIQKPKTWGSK